MKPDEIKKGLGWCSRDTTLCTEACPYYGSLSNGVDCASELKADALTYIQQLEERCKTLNQLRDAAAGRALKMEERVHQLERERDELVEIIRNEPNFNLVPLQCRYCKNFNGDFTKDTCRFCGTQASFGNFEWRGAKDTRTGASDGCTGASGV